MPDPKQPVDPEEVRRLEAAVRELGKQLGASVAEFGGPGRWGFVLLLFKWDSAELAYVSNAERNDTIRMLQEFINRYKNRDPGTQSARN